MYPYSTFLFFLGRYSPPYVKVESSARAPCPGLCSPLVLCFVCFSVYLLCLTVSPTVASFLQPMGLLKSVLTRSALQSFCPGPSLTLF